MRFEWDEKKNQLNFRKHGVWFEEAQTSWADPMALEYFDPDHSEDEDRFLRIGYSTNNRMLLVSFCEREEGDVVRIIHSRKATPEEVKSYEKRI